MGTVIVKNPDWHLSSNPLRPPPAAMVRNSYLLRQDAWESNARSYPRRLPIAISEARGIYVKDTEGNVYIDCLAGAGALVLGHNHPVAVEAIREALASRLPMHTLDLTTPVKDHFMEELLDSLPPELAGKMRIQFCGPSGADAVEAAIKLVKTATGRRAMLSFRGGYHGMTHGALALSGNLAPKEPITGLVSDIHFLPYPYSYRCPFGLGGEAGQRASSAYIERMLDDPESGVVTPAGMILEVIQGEGGVLPAPVTWLREIRRITRERGIPLIIDEVQTGWGRTGTLYAFAEAGIEPDVIILSKAIGGGLPLAVIVYKKELDHWKPGAHAGTFRGNQLAMAAGIATLRLIQQQQLTCQAKTMGERLLGHLQRVLEKNRCLGEVRGLGLMVGVEVVDAEGQPDAIGTRPAAPALAQRIQAEALRRGLILEIGGRHGSVVRFLPPLIVTAELIDQIASIFSEAVVAAQRQPVNQMKALA